MNVPDASCLFLSRPHDRHRAPFLPPPPSTIAHHRSSYHPLDCRPQPPQSHLFAGPLTTSNWTNAAPPQLPSLWPAGPPDFLLPFHSYQTRDYDSACYSALRSDTSSAVSRDSDLSPSPEIAQVVCNAPLVAPKPLPYHSPTFLLYDLPDEDEDLSHPPYTHRPHKRKRARDEDSHSEAQQTFNPQSAKRRLIAEGSQRWSSSAAQWASSAAPPAPPPVLRRPLVGSSRRNRMC